MALRERERELTYRRHRYTPLGARASCHRRPAIARSFLCANRDARSPRIALRSQPRLRATDHGRGRGVRDRRTACARRATPKTDVRCPCLIISVYAVVPSTRRGTRTNAARTENAGGQPLSRGQERVDRLPFLLFGGWARVRRRRTPPLPYYYAQHGALGAAGAERERSEGQRLSLAPIFMPVRDKREEARRSRFCFQMEMENRETIKTRMARHGAKLGCFPLFPTPATRILFDI